MTGVQIGEYHTFRDWGLYLRSVDISLPQKKEYKISLPAGNGELDFSDALTGGKPKFYNRLISMNFEAETADDGVLFLKASEIANIIHGRKEKIIFDDDRGFYYTGVCSVIFNRKNPMITSFSISVDADPFKYGSEMQDIIGTLESKNIDIKGDYEAPCIIELMPTGPIIDYTIKGAARNPVTGEPEDLVLRNLEKGKKVIIDGEAMTITQDGQNKFAEAEIWEFPSLLPGTNILTFHSSSVPCEVTIKYRPRYI